MRAPFLLALIVLVATPVGATQVTRVVRKDSPSLRIPSQRSELLPYDRVAAEPSEAVQPRAAKLLPAPAFGCEFDGTLDPFTTLLLDPGDMAGTILPIPANYSPYVLGEVHLGLFDYNSAYPAQLDILVLELTEDGNSYDSIAAFTVDVEGEIAAEGEVVEVDLREFEVAGARELLVLYGAAGASANALLLPASDASPRCAPQTIESVCGVLLPSGGDSLFIYGVIDETACARTTHHIILHDVAIEVVLDVQEVPSSFGRLKARF